MLWSWQSVGDLLARGDSWIGVLGLLVVSILYLPNVMIGAAAVLAGSTVEFGDVRLSLFEASGGDLPALPVLAAIPPGPAPSFWPVALAVPATVGALLGRYVAKRNLEAQARGEYVSAGDGALTVLAASAEAGVVTALATWMAGGRLGFFGVVGANWWLAGILVFAWLGLLGLITAQLLLWREGKLAEAEAAHEPETDDPAEPDDSGEPATAGGLDEPKALEAAPGADPDPESSDTDDTDDPNVVDAEVVEDDEESEAKPDEKNAGDSDVVDVEIDDEISDGDLPKGTRNTSD
jgi:hypothetical protein